MGAKARTSVGSEINDFPPDQGGEEGEGVKHAALRRRALVVSISIDGAETCMTRLGMDPGSSKKDAFPLLAK